MLIPNKHILTLFNYHLINKTDLLVLSHIDRLCKKRNANSISGGDSWYAKLAEDLNMRVSQVALTIEKLEFVGILDYCFVDRNPNRRDKLIILYYCRLREMANEVRSCS